MSRRSPLSPDIKTLLLGEPCPLCGRPNPIWIGGIERETAEKILAEFPGWTPEAGACEQCIETHAPPRLI